LAELLKDHTSPEQLIVVVNVQVMSLHTDQKCSNAILDILSWLKVFSIFSTVLLSTEDTTKEKAADLAAHWYLIFQMSKDLQSSQWSQYDQILVNRQQSRVFANGESLISPFMAVVWPPNSPPFLKLQPQDPSRRGRLISTSATNGLVALPVTDLPAAMLIDAGLAHRAVELSDTVISVSQSIL